MASALRTDIRPDWNLYSVKFALAKSTVIVVKYTL